MLAKSKVNKVLSHKLTFEISAFIASLCFVLIGFFIVSSSLTTEEIKQKPTILTLDNASPASGLVPNYSNGLSTELMLMSSLSRTDQITLFGSSEFSSNENSSYQFLPSKHGIPTMGFGHAFHQSFSIYCELLAANEYLKDSKVVIFLSPGWFETEGTNTEAFLEFVPAQFLEKIWMDPKVSQNEKVEIGRYIYNNADKFSSLTYRMQAFKTLYESENEMNLASKLRTKLLATFPALNKGKSVKYEVKSVPPIKLSLQTDFTNLQKKAREDFRKNSANNSIFVDSTYYSNFVLQADGSIKDGSVSPIDLAKSTEYKDFKLLLKLLTDRKVNCSFVIQGLNPHYYHNLSEMDPMIRTIIAHLEKENIPYLNMFTSRKSDYLPGVLTDVMHLGDLGWLQVNEFIYNTYIK